MTKQSKIEKQTVGKIVSDLNKLPPILVNVVDLVKDMEQEDIANLMHCIKDGKSIIAGDFFIQISVKMEPILKVLSKKWEAKNSCPTPNYDQVVFHYLADKEQIRFIWVIPDRETCQTFIENKNIIVPSEQQLLQNIIDFADGTLAKLCLELNKHKPDILLFKKEEGE